jgi:hypothetical protein
VPIGGEMGVNVAILSYDGIAYVGFGGDVHAVPDIERFEDLLRTSFAELHDAAVAELHSTKVAKPAVKVSGSPRAANRTKMKKEARSQPRAKVEVVPVSEVGTRRRRATGSKTTAPFPPTMTAAAAATDHQVLAQSGD